MQLLNSQEITRIINDALDEDLGENGDITSNLTIPDKKQIKFQISNREPIILCGCEIAMIAFHQTKERLGIKDKITLKNDLKDGDSLKKGQIIISGISNARLVLAWERIALNILQHLSGIATATNQYVREIKNNKTKILDTRKTAPGLRMLQKYAVRTGGGKNHRFALHDGILIKDNHIEAAGGIKNAILEVRNGLKSIMDIEVECDNINQVREAVEAQADIIMLDNMNLEQIKESVSIIGNKARIEVSGGVTLDKIKEISKINIDYISIGSLTHSVRAVDIGLDVMAI